MFLSKNLKYLRLNAGYSQEFIANKLGYKSFTTIQKWESGISEPSLSTVHKLCNLYDINIDDILYKDLSVPRIEKIDNLITLDKTKRIPIVGSIAAGKPKLAVEDIDSYIILDNELDADFALKIESDSMIDAGINNGDLALIKKDMYIENGDIGAVMVDESATLKKIYRHEDYLMLQACNSKYPPIIVREEDNPYIIGKLTGIVRKY